MSSRKERRGKDSTRLEQELFGDPAESEPRSLQLCRQADEAIATALACAASPLLRELSVLRVEPQRGAAVLRVLIAAKEGGDEETKEALERASGYLRAEVARSISRKRVPALSFVVVPAEEDEVDHE